MSRHTVAAFFFGLLLAVCGIPFTDWRFWVLMPAAVIWAQFISKEPTT